MPPSASAAQETSHNLDGDSGLSALGRDYEKKKQKLLLELQLEYKDYVSKKKESKGRVCDRQHQALSLPVVEEKISIKDRLREERQKEYNLFLQEQPQTRRVTRGAPPVTSKNTQTGAPPRQKESPESRRNAATLTEAGDYRRSPDCRGHGPRRRRRWQIHQPKKTQSSEEELNTDEEEEDFDFRRRRRRERSTYEREYREGRGTPERRGRRALQNTREMEALSIRDQSSSDGTRKPGISPTPQNEKTSTRSTPPTYKEEKELATGLMIGAVEERSVTQMKKEQYKQELLQQIAERQKNKIKEKKALLNVDATDSGKERLGAAPREHQSLTPDVLDPKWDNRPESSPHRAPGPSPLVRFGPAFSQLPVNPFPPPGMGTVQMVPPLDYYAGITGMQGPVGFPWVPVVPPVPHIVSSPDRSQHDAAFYQEGTRYQDYSSDQIQIQFYRVLVPRFITSGMFEQIGS
ncbi:centrosome and spindle pole-associated protein 1 [Fundulus heteroclitus]|uniref:centrosome and spindle pole-associated protein 1 n=1 Tax=Fundulus heteroclitus TaxID=8078 RepID=UPI00165CA9E8|nr:centrosome and spindle pole-associated protein 1 [Fundulus heteroclitus]